MCFANIVHVMKYNDFIQIDIQSFVSVNHGWFNSIISIHKEILPNTGHSSRSTIQFIQLSKSVCNMLLLAERHLSFGIFPARSEYNLRIWSNILYIRIRTLHFILFICSNVANAEHFEDDYQFRKIHWRKYGYSSVLHKHFWISFVVILFVTGPHAKSTYNDLIVKIEKMCDFMYFVLVDVSLVGFLLPALLITLINYYVYDLNEESYILPAPTMYTRLTTWNHLLNEMIVTFLQSFHKVSIPYPFWILDRHYGHGVRRFLYNTFEHLNHNIFCCFNLDIWVISQRYCIRFVSVEWWRNIKCREE